jgi:hypothetical protein
MSVPAIACTLDAAALPARLDEWRALVGKASARTPVDGGLGLDFGADVSAAAIADLAARELACCAFFDFTVRITSGGVRLEVRAPEEARGLVEELLEGKGAAPPGRCGCSAG